MLRATPLCIAILGLAGCATSTGGAAAPGDAALRYMCEGGPAFFARFMANAVSLDFGRGGPEVMLTQQTDSPFHYSSSDYDMTGDANQIRLSQAGGAPMTCLRGNPRDLMPVMR